MHDGHFVQVDPWQHVSLLETLTQSIFWDIWPSVAFYTGVGALVCCLDLLPTTDYHIALPSTMLTVLGTVIGFVVSYRCHSAYARYLEGSQLWGQLIHLSRSFARHVWFHVPNQLQQSNPGETIPERDQAQALIEKKTIINLVEAHAVAVKHYLRGEPGSFYEDVWHSVACLPRYAMPLGIPHRESGSDWHMHSGSLTHLFGSGGQHSGSHSEKHQTGDHPVKAGHQSTHSEHIRGSHSAHLREAAQTGGTPLKRTPTAPEAHKTVSAPASSAPTEPSRPSSWSGSTAIDHHGVHSTSKDVRRPQELLRPLHIHGDHLRHQHDLPSPPPMHGPRNPPVPLMPARLPPPFNFVDDVAPFLDPFRKVFRWIKARTETPEQKTRRLRKQRKHALHEDNLPLEIQLYFASYLATLERRHLLSVPIMSAILRNLEELQQNLSHLEKIVTTPIPFAYSVHLKHSTMLYLVFLPFQLERYLGWVTIPAMFIASFMFLGFLGVAAQIEGPFGYDTNDLDLDSMCSTIIAKELREMTSRPPAGPDDYIFSNANEPFFPADKRSARTLAKQNVTVAEIEHILLQGHKHDLGLRSLREQHKQKHKGSKSSAGDFSHDTHPFDHASKVV